MVQRVFVKVVGFTDVERHALNTLFRLSEEHEAIYSPWTPGAPEAPQLVLIDGDAYEGQLELESPATRDLRLIWVGESPPKRAWRSFERPLAWPDVIESMDELFAPAAADLDFDIDFDLATEDIDTRPPDTVPPDMPPAKRALIASGQLETRLYWRARLALAHLTQADDASSAAEALEFARANAYAVALVDMSLPGMDPWVFLKELREARTEAPDIVLVKSRPSLVERARAWLVGAKAMLGQPPDPARLQSLLEEA